MRILVLSNKMPYPRSDGGSIATLNLSLSLAQLGHEITILAMNTAKHFFPIENVPAEIKNKIGLIGVDVQARISILGAVKNLLFSKNAYTAERFYSSVYLKKLIDLLQSKSFDIVQLEGLYVGMYLPMIRKYSQARIVYRAHNLEFEIWERASLQSNLLKQWYFKILADRLLKLEKELLHQYDAILPISDKDGRWFLEQKSDVQIHTAPAGIPENFQKNTTSLVTELDLFYIGALDWLPNQEGLQWFFKNVWPKIHEKHPSLKFYLAGRNASKEIKSLKAPNLVFLGEVENAADFMLAHHILVVPLFSGSGMRIKIIEAMALGKAVISTALGLEGNQAKNKQQVLIANNADEFLLQIESLLSNPDQIHKLGKSAKDFVIVHFDQQKIAKKVETFYTEILM